MCLYGKLIRNKKYTPNIKNNGIPPDVKDWRTMAVPIGCGVCIECVKQKARYYQVRLLEDIRTNKNGKFVTLTFSNQSIKKISRKLKEYKGYELDNMIATYATRMFTERWRKKYKKAPRHWLITELGHEGTENIHLHGIIWTDKTFEEIKERWNYGFIYPNTKAQQKKNYVTERTINYIIKYIAKQDQEHKYYKPKILSSKGIGANYLNRWDSKLNKYKPNETKETYTTRTGHEIGLPIYWRNKIYTEEERELLWIEKLNKKERWVCGEKVDITNGEKEYIELRNYHRKKAQRLGYRDNKINLDEKGNEELKRIINLDKRLKN